VIAFGLVLGAAGSLQYSALRSSLIRARVASMRVDLAAGRADFERIPRLRSQAARLQLCDRSATPQTARNAALQLSDAVTVVTGRAVTVVIYDSELLPLLGTDAPPAGSGARTAPRLSAAGLKQALGGAEAEPEVVEDLGGPQLVVGFPVQLDPGHRCAVAQMSTSMQPIDEVLGNERRLLTLAAAAALLLACGAVLTGAIRGGIRPAAR